jgi:hypothetical protein
MFHLPSFCLGLVPVRAPSGYANPLAVQDALDPFLTMTTSPDAIVSAGTLCVAGIDEKMHQKRDKRKAKIQLKIRRYKLVQTKIGRL